MGFMCKQVGKMNVHVCPVFVDQEGNGGLRLFSAGVNNHGFKVIVFIVACIYSLLYLPFSISYSFKYRSYTLRCVLVCI